MKKVTFQLEQLVCPSCSLKIESALKGLDGVDTDSIKILFNASKARLNFDENTISIEEIKKTIEDVGFQVEKQTLKDA